MCTKSLRPNASKLPCVAQLTAKTEETFLAGVTLQLKKLQETKMLFTFWNPGIVWILFCVTSVPFTCRDCV